MTQYTLKVETNISEEPAASIFTVKDEAMWEKMFNDTDTWGQGLGLRVNQWELGNLNSDGALKEFEIEKKQGRKASFLQRWSN